MDKMLKNLRIAIFNIMEKMFFLLPDPEEETGTSPEYTSVYIGVTGNPAVVVTFMVDDNLGQRMAGDLMGLEPEDVDRDVIVKCLQETANVIAGRFMLLFDDAAERNLTLPQTEKDAVLPGCALSEGGELSCTFEGMAFSAKLETHQS